jgi:hypothetical protein
MLRPAASPWSSFAPRTRAAVATRCININATRSSSEPSLAPQVNVDADSVPAASPGMPPMLYQTETAANSDRCPLRGHRHALFAALRLALGLADALHPPRNAGRPQWEVGKHPLDALCPRALPPRPRRHPVPLPEGVIDQPSYSSHLDQVAHIEHRLRKPRWQAGLGHQSTAGAACLDWPYAEPKAAVQCQVGAGQLGKHIHHGTRTAGTGRQGPDLPGAGQGGRDLCCASQVGYPPKTTHYRLTACSNVVAYTASTTPPMPFRFKSSNIRFQIPDLGFGTLMQRIEFIKKAGESAAWRTLATTFHTLKTWMRRSVWGDRVSNQTTFSVSFKC